MAAPAAYIRSADRDTDMRELVHLRRRSRTGVLEEPLIADPSSVTIRSADEEDAGTLHELISEHLTEGRLLTREPGEVAAHSGRFIVAAQGGTVLACAELAPLSASVAEVRSLIVRREARGLGLGRRIIEEIARRAAAAGYLKLCAFTHSPAYFVHLGFSIVPHAWLPEKIVTDCHRCSHFRACGQYAVVRPLEQSRKQSVPTVLRHG